jgi:histidine transport system ATP-binding protein
MTHKASKELLRVENLHKQYGDKEVLKGVSLTANAGDVISIIGSSGSGKSTWLRCINFLEQPTSGRIIVAGEEVKLLPGHKMNSSLPTRSNCRESAPVCRWSSSISIYGLT